MSEIWRAVKGFESTYLVSSGGSVYSVPRPSTRGGILKPLVHPSYGYTQVSLTQHGIQHKVYIHDLVAEAFIGAKPRGFHVDHINRSRADNRAENLRYLTHAENSSQGGDSQCGESNHRARLNEQAVKAIRWAHKSLGATAALMARLYRVQPGTVELILRHKTWRHVA